MDFKDAHSVASSEEIVKLIEMVRGSIEYYEHNSEPTAAAIAEYLRDESMASAVRNIVYVAELMRRMMEPHWLLFTPEDVDTGVSRALEMLHEELS